MGAQGLASCNCLKPTLLLCLCDPTEGAMAFYAASTLLEITCDPSSSFFGFMGLSSAIIFANLGAAYGTAKSGVGIMFMGVMRPDMVMRSIIPVVMAGVLGIYGLITAVIINGKMAAAEYSAYSGYAHLGA